MMIFMLNKLNDRHMNSNKEKYNNNFNGNYGGNPPSNEDDFYDHPSWEEIMAFVTATKDYIMNEPVNAFKMIAHFCQCEECRTVKNEMMIMEDELNTALEMICRR